MHRSIVGAALIAAALQLCAAPALAVDVTQAKNPHPAASGPPTMAGQANKPKKAAKLANVKLVDINTAGKAELKKLPGIGDAQADQIIAKRPFGSKADLTTRGIVPEGIYLMLKDRVIASEAGLRSPAAQIAGVPPPEYTLGWCRRTAGCGRLEGAALRP